MYIALVARLQLHIMEDQERVPCECPSPSPSSPLQCLYCSSLAMQSDWFHPCDHTHWHSVMQHYFVTHNLTFPLQRLEMPWEKVQHWRKVDHQLASLVSAGSPDMSHDLRPWFHQAWPPLDPDAYQEWWRGYGSHRPPAHPVSVQGNEVRHKTLVDVSTKVPNARLFYTIMSPLHV